jgi:hypothetical protein
MDRDLDNYITGHYGEDQFRGEEECEEFTEEDCDCSDRSWYGEEHDSACPLAGQLRPSIAPPEGED